MVGQFYDRAVSPVPEVSRHNQPIPYGRRSHLSLNRLFCPVHFCLSLQLLQCSYRSTQYFCGAFQKSRILLHYDGYSGGTNSLRIRGGQYPPYSTFDVGGAGIYVPVGSDGFPCRASAQGMEKIERARRGILITVGYFAGALYFLHIDQTLFCSIALTNKAIHSIMEIMVYPN